MPLPPPIWALLKTEEYGTVPGGDRRRQPAARQAYDTGVLGRLPGPASLPFVASASDNSTNKTGDEKRRNGRPSFLLPPGIQLDVVYHGPHHEVCIVQAL